MGLYLSHDSRDKPSAHFLTLFPPYSSSNDPTFSDDYHWSFLFSVVCPRRAHLGFPLGCHQRIIGKGKQDMLLSSQWLNSLKSSLNKLFFWLSSLQTIQVPWDTKMKEWQIFSHVCVGNSGQRWRYILKKGILLSLVWLKMRKYHLRNVIPTRTKTRNQLYGMFIPEESLEISKIT